MGENDLSGWLIDETAVPSKGEASAIASRALGFDEGPAEAQLAVALHDVTILKTGRLFGEAEIRLDALVVTAAPGTAAYAPGTFRFPRIGSGDKLQIGEGGLGIFLGDPRGLLDISIVVSRAQEDDKSLEELLAEAGDVASLLGDVTKLAAPAPQVAAITAAGGAAVKLSTVALRLLAKYTGRSIGVYRTTWWESGEFGIGKHPNDGTRYRNNDFEFWYRIFRNAPHR
ncbi:MAG TPA: hypothetical protein VK272_01725 [Solirubrobacteraceae bacterium]|nr:hypothetical protein [Solirubrobacteraceae bacterium]